MALAKVRTSIQPAVILHRCTCLNCSVALATKAEECICYKEIDHVDEIMSAINQAGDCVFKSMGSWSGIAHSHDQSCPGGISDKPSHEKEASIYKTVDQFDGYKALRLYVEKANPNCSSFFQYPKANFSPEEDVWFEQRPLGINTLTNIMKKISEAASLSKIYTNHSVQATAITLWSNACISKQYIMSISGYRNKKPLAYYNCLFHSFNE